MQESFQAESFVMQSKTSY